MIRVSRSGSTISMRNSDYPVDSVFCSPWDFKYFIEAVKDGAFDSISVLPALSMQEWEDAG
jgi:hypothetical protein